MATAVKRRVSARRVRAPLGPQAAGIPMTGKEFDKADFERGWRYELIHGVLVVSPTPLEQERDPNEELGHWLRTYRETHPQGRCLDKTLPEQTVVTGEDRRRRADRVLWIGLGRRPTVEDVPTIIVEFVSEGKRNWLRDYKEKRREYLELGAREYWLFNRFDRTLSVFSEKAGRARQRDLTENDTLTSLLLPGFEAPLKKHFALADEWE